MAGRGGQRALRALTKVTLRTPPLVSEPMVIPCPVPMMLLAHTAATSQPQLILWLAAGASNEGPSSRVLVLVPPFLGPGFRLGARWNRLGEPVKTRKKREKMGEKRARYV